jgi:hypothetical protein
MSFGACGFHLYHRYVLTLRLSLCYYDVYISVCNNVTLFSLYGLDPSRSRALLIGGYFPSAMNVFGEVWECGVTKRSKPMGSKSGIVACDNCTKKGLWNKCSGCKQASYCGRKCQLEHYPVHKVLCKTIKRNI